MNVALQPPGELMLTLVKFHGIGNDFLVGLDPGGAGLGATIDSAVARRLCDRHEGIGADGLVLGQLLSRGGPGEKAKMTFRLWNADGTEAEMSGNGVRCLAHAALDEGWVGEGRPFAVVTPAGPREVVVRRTSDSSTVWGEVAMGVVKIVGDEERCNIGHGQLLVDVGNPHLVVLGPDPATVDVGRLGPLLEVSQPGRLNVEFVTLGPGLDTATMRVWERGVGETMACGTGSCAVAAALHHWGRVGTAVTVHQPGGTAAVTLLPDGKATLAGPSVRIATCLVSL